MKKIKNGDGTIQNLNLYNDILKKLVFDFQVPIAGAKITAAAIYDSMVNKKMTWEEALKYETDFAEQIPDEQHPEKTLNGRILEKDLFFEILKRFHQKGYPDSWVTKIHAKGVYESMHKDYDAGCSIDEVISFGDRSAMENLPDLHK